MNEKQKQGEDILDNLEAVHGRKVAAAADLLATVTEVCIQLSKVHDSKFLVSVLLPCVAANVDSLAELTPEQSQACRRTAATLVKLSHAA